MMNHRPRVRADVVLHKRVNGVDTCPIRKIAIFQVTYSFTIGVTEFNSI